MADVSRTNRVAFSRILGLGSSLALGFSVSLGLVINVGAGAVMSISPDGVIVALVLALILYLPVLLTYAEMAAGRPGSASAYQISRFQSSTGMTFVTGWLMLAGLVSAATLLSQELAMRLDYMLQSLYQVDIDHVWFLVVAMFLGGVNEWITGEDRWRSRTMLVWAGLGVLVVVLIWATLAHPSGEAEFPRLMFQGHDLAKVAVLAIGLWFADMLLNHRRQMIRPDKTLKWSLIGVWSGTLVLTMVTARIVRRSPSLMMEFWPEKLSWGEQGLELLILMVGVLFVWVGLSRLVSRTVRLSGAMTADGFLPTIVSEDRRRSRALIALVVMGTAVVLAARWLPSSQLLAVSASSFLLTTLLVTLPYARRPARELSPDRRNRLPLHPLFPGLTVVVCAAMTAVLPRIGQGVLAVWLLLGGLFYLAYARSRARTAIQEEKVAGDVEELQAKTVPRILIGAGDKVQLPSLLKLGWAMARDLDAEVVVLRVLPTGDELSTGSLQREAELEWEVLDKLVAGYEITGVSVLSLVRIAPSVEAGILAAASEYNIDLLVLGAEELPRDAPPSPVLSKIFASTSRRLVMLRGQIEDEPLDVVVGTSGGPHAPLALRLGASIAATTGGELELIAVVPQAQSEETAREAIEATLEKADIGRDVEHRIVEAKNAESGLIEASQQGKILILGSSIDRLLRRTVLDGLPLEISRIRQGATMVVKRAEAAMLFWQRRLWDVLARYTPNLTVSERSHVYSQMRHSAKADTDFYALISLSSAIATLGLLLDSGAVIIGAMLVAPLMSPILAIAQGIVQGNLMLIQRAGASTFKGMTVSIGVATVITALLPNMQPTSEILARTSPNLLDLGVALAAGAAAAWAVSRSSVAAALPGVAIAVALVPPLGVVGYGLGTSQFGISGGAFLLFLTNLAAIVLIGALVFVLLGFRPTRVEREAQVRKAAVVAIVTVAILIIPLGLTTMQMSRKARIEAEIEAYIEGQTARSFRIWEFEVSRRDRVFLVEGTVYAFKGFETERIFDFQEELQARMGVPIEVQLTIVPATLTKVGGTPEPETSGGPEVLPSTPE